MSLLQKDQCHLSSQGTERLLSNLGLQDLACSRIVQHESSDKVSAPAPSSTSEPWNKVVSRKKKRAERLNQSNNPITIEDDDDDVQTMPQVPPPAPAPPKPPTSKRKINFQGHQHPLSNFFACELDIYDRTFYSSEAAYQYRKALEYEEWDLAEEIALTQRAIDAKRLGDTIHTDEQWWKMRESVMMEIITEKAKQCPEFKNTLLASQGNSLVEDTQHKFWGRGRQEKGKNKLGVLLEILRSNITSSPKQRAYTPKKREGSVKSHPASHGNRRDPGCGFCGERGHSSDTCGHGRPIRCRNCQGYRHKEKHCWYEQQ